MTKEELIEVCEELPIKQVFIAGTLCNIAMIIATLIIIL